MRCSATLWRYYWLGSLAPPQGGHSDLDSLDSHDLPTPVHRPFIAKKFVERHVIGEMESEGQKESNTLNKSPKQSSKIAGMENL